MAFDFEGARRICQATGKPGGEHPDGQAYTIDQMAAGYAAHHAGKYAQAIEHFRNVHDPAVRTKFFLHWGWPMMAQLESSNAWLMSGGLFKARAAADGYLESALSTADPQMRALAWEMKTRVGWPKTIGETRAILSGEPAIVDKFEILVAAWQTFATAWQVHQLRRGAAS